MAVMSMKWLDWLSMCIRHSNDCFYVVCTFVAFQMFSVGIPCSIIYAKQKQKHSNDRTQNV